MTGNPRFWAGTANFGRKISIGKGEPKLFLPTPTSWGISAKRFRVRLRDLAHKKRSANPDRQVPRFLKCPGGSPCVGLNISLDISIGAPFLLLLRCC